MTRRARKRDFRGGSISEFFNTIGAQRTTRVDVHQTLVTGPSTRPRSQRAIARLVPARHRGDPARVGLSEAARAPTRPAGKAGSAYSWRRAAAAAIELPDAPVAEIERAEAP
jgi:hypothetical protein